MTVIPINVVREALRLRSTHGIALATPVDVYSLAKKRGLEVRFLRVNSLEGMYVSGRRPAILLPSDRPRGRQRFSCAHELGHHEFSHGIRLDLIRNHAGLRPAEERLADLFAGFLLMPKLAVLRGFVAREAAPRNPSAEQVLYAAQWLGVGYSSLLRHMQASLGLITRAQADVLGTTTPRKVLEELLGRKLDADAVVVDSLWDGLPIDVAVGEYISVTGGGSVEGHVVERIGGDDAQTLLRAIRPGIGRLQGRNWAAFIRVSRPSYEGLAHYRHLADSEYDD